MSAGPGSPPGASLQAPAEAQAPAASLASAAAPATAAHQAMMQADVPAVVQVAPPDFADWPGLLALLQHSFAYMAPRIDPPSSLQGMSADDLARKARSETLLLAQAGPRLLGCAFAQLRGDCVYLGKLAVADSARRQGLAGRLVDAAAELARLHQRPWLVLQTRVELVENHRTFAALGFAVVAHTAHPGFDRPTSVTMRRSVAVR